MTISMSPNEKPLQQLRVEIDAVDQKLVQLINRRAEMAIEFFRQKRVSNDGQISERLIEAEFLKSAASKNKGPIPNSALEGIYRQILNGSSVLARPTRVGYLGPQGTFLSLIHI